MRKFLFFIFVVFVLLPCGWLLFNEFEQKDPDIEMVLPSAYLKRSYDISTTVRDRGTGLKQVKITISQGDKKKVLLDKKYPFMGYQFLFMGGGDQTENLTVPVESWKYGMVDGEALITVEAWDHSWNGWNRGNLTMQEQKVIIDTRPPRIEVLTKVHNISRGGSGLAVYRLFEPDVQSGVRVGDNYFPGYSGLFKDPFVHASFFALSHLQGPGTEIFVQAVDAAGNMAKRGFYHYIREKRFKKDTLNISDSFLSRKMPEFELQEKEFEFTKAAKPELEKFIYINQTLRQQNIEAVFEPLVADSAHDILWKGKFLRLSGAANRASFADHRTYKYNGKTIDKEYHMGIDLASVSNAPVPAANTGRVIITDNIGIFGNLVMIDHGMGVATIYSHLSSISVKKGDSVNRGDIIGRTGATGLAGGDHLHFGVAVHNVFVNPVEWWDMSWLKNNILDKIEDVKSQL
ncbi:M23 family metallopeptidase [Desulfocicer niacini]